MRVPAYPAVETNTTAAIQMTFRGCMRALA